MWASLMGELGYGCNRRGRVCLHGPHTEPTNKNKKDDRVHFDRQTYLKLVARFSIILTRIPSMAHKSDTPTKSITMVALSQTPVVSNELMNSTNRLME